MVYINWKISIKMCYSAWVIWTSPVKSKSSFLLSKNFGKFNFGPDSNLFKKLAQKLHTSWRLIRNSCNITSLENLAKFDKSWDTTDIRSSFLNKYQLNQTVLYERVRTDTFLCFVIFLVKRLTPYLRYRACFWSQCLRVIGVLLIRHCTREISFLLHFRF